MFLCGNSCFVGFVLLCATDAWFILCTNKIYTYVLKKSYFIFPITKGSVNALMKLAGFSTSNKVKNHWFRTVTLFHKLAYKTNLSSCLGSHCLCTSVYVIVLMIEERKLELISIYLFDI